MKFKSLLMVVSLGLMLGACVPLPAATSTATPPPAVDAPAKLPDMTSGLAMIDSVEVQVLTGASPALLVIARGNLSDGCTSIDETSWVQDGDAFTVTITTVRPADLMCTQALVPFEETVLIEPESALEPGTYTVDVNGMSTEVTL